MPDRWGSEAEELLVGNINPRSSAVIDKRALRQAIVDLERAIVLIRSIEQMCGVLTKRRIEFERNIQKYHEALKNS